jgi:DNA-binding NarL/FixJ family response regulator
MPGSPDRTVDGGEVIGVVIVEPFPVIRAGLARAIAADPRFDVLAETGSADEALAALERATSSPVVTLAAVGLRAEHDAFWLIRALRERFPHHVILGLAANAAPDVVSRALFVGADGFLDESVELSTFLDGIARAADRDVVITGPAAASVGEIAEGIERRRDVGVRLTSRELEVLAVAAEGLTAREIGVRLGVQERTITTHLARIYGKLGVGSRLAAIRVASRGGLVSIAQIDDA